LRGSVHVAPLLELLDEDELDEELLELDELLEDELDEELLELELLLELLVAIGHGSSQLMSIFTV